jgi:hypothetical protein
MYSSFGETKTLNKWQRDSRCQVNVSTLSKRLSNSLTLGRTITLPLQKKNLRLAFGEWKTNRAWAKDKRCQVTYAVLNTRINTYKWHTERAIVTPTVYKNASEYVGKTFQYVKIEKITGKNKRGCAIVSCRCVYNNCNKIFETRLNNAKIKQSCGCLKHENHIKRITKHGYTKHDLYHTWYSMNERCDNKKDADYGARNIVVCEELKNNKNDKLKIGLKNFLHWAESHPRPDEYHSLDRINNDGPYSPINCRWATASEQNKNQRNVKYFVNKLAEKDSKIYELENKIKELEKTQVS